MGRVWKAVREHWRQEVIGGLFFACLVTILFQSGLLTTVDSVSLHASARLLPPADLFSQPADPSESPPVPRVVVIGPALYETTFRQASPLDRGAVRDLLAALFPEGRRPRVLAIDLDLSPDPGGGPGAPSPGQGRLDDLLGDLVDGGTRVVLITPMPVVTGEAYAPKRAWMGVMCRERGVAFGLPDVVSDLGTVLYAEAGLPTLAVEAMRPFRDAPGGPRSVCDTYFPPDHDPPATLLTAGWPHRPEDYRAKPARRPINFRFFRLGNPVHLNAPGAAPPPVGVGPADVVFLGGEYGEADKYLTPVGIADGLYLHAAAFYSLGHPVRDLNHAGIGLRVGGVVGDFLTGSVLGVIFAGLFGLHDAWRHIPGRRMVSLALNLVTPLLATLALVVLAGLLLRRNLWIHPAPMAVGMLLSTAVAWLHGPPARAAGATPARFGVGRAIEWALYAAVVATGVYIFFSD